MARRTRSPRPAAASALSPTSELDVVHVGQFRGAALPALYATIARKHLVPLLGNRPLDRILPSDVEALIVAKRQAGLAPSTIWTIYIVLRGALDVAVRDELLRRNPTTSVKRPTVDRRDAAYLTIDDAQRLLDEMRRDRLDPRSG